MEDLVDLFERAVAYGANPSTSDDPTAPFEANTWGGEAVLLDALHPALGGEMPRLLLGGHGLGDPHPVRLPKRDARSITTGAFRTAGDSGR